jgi:hypothetical protein
MSPSIFIAMVEQRQGDEAEAEMVIGRTTRRRAAELREDAHDEWNYLERGETPTQRLDRNYADILQEVRVAQTGVQLLLAFLLTLAFTPRFAQFTELQRDVYVASLVLGATSTALLIAPAPFHRLVFRRRLKKQLVRASNRFALCGLVLLMLALASALMLILDVVLGTSTAVWITGGLLGWFSLWWYVVPLCCRLLAAGRSPGSHAPTRGLTGDVGAGPDTQLRQHVRDVRGHRAS